MAVDSDEQLTSTPLPGKKDESETKVAAATAVEEQDEEDEAPVLEKELQLAVEVTFFLSVSAAFVLTNLKCIIEIYEDLISWSVSSM